MSNKLLICLGLAVLAVGATGCNTTDNANTNANANATVASSTTRPGPDGSEITTTTDAEGVKTETRVFHNNPRVARVVVTTRDGRRTTKVYAPSGESRDFTDKTEDALVATGAAIADGAGFVADKTVDGAKAVGEGAKTVGEKTVDGAKAVGERTGDVAKTVGQKTGQGAKKVGQKTVEGAKKTGSAIKRAVTP